jgi:hypothetical protein
MNATHRHHTSPARARSRAGLTAAAILLAPAISSGQFLIPGVKPPHTAVEVIRINVDEYGKPACATNSSTVVAVVDDIVNDVVTVTVNDYSGSTTVSTKEYMSSVLRKIDVRFCGPSNSFTYQLAANNYQLSLPREFRLNGGSSTDYVVLQFANNAAGQPVTMTSAPTADIRLGGLPPSLSSGTDDSVGIYVRNVGGGTMRLTATLGTGNDGLSFVTHAKPMEGSLDLTVEGGAGDDTLWFDLWDPVSQVDIPAGKTVSIRASGDTLDSLSTQANVADHGMDRVQGGFRGTVDGTLVLQFHGDDKVVRSVSSQCATTDCVLFCQGSACAQPTGLEAVMEADPWYASDIVQAQVRLLDGSTGTVDIDVDGGLGSDGVSLNVTNDNQPSWSTVYPFGSFQQYSTELSGGQSHYKKTDYCYASPYSATQLVAWEVTMTGCNVFEPSLATIW